MKRFSLAYIKQLPKSQTRLTFSTVLTLMRIALTPIIVAAMIWQQWGMAFGLFVIAIVTDLLDGYIARVWNQQTFLGACLDPIADKVLLVSCFAALAFVHTPLFTIPLWFVYVVLIKELLLVVGAALLLLSSEQRLIQPTWLGKMTTTVQMLFIVWLFACYFFCWVPIKTYLLMLGLLLLLVLASLLHYISIGIKVLQHKSV